MKRYSVKVTSRALADMDAIYEHIAVRLQAPETALRQYDRIAAAIESLCSFPGCNPLIDVQPELDLGMRRMLVDNYSVIYVVHEATVTVLRILYSSSDVIARLKKE